VETDMNDKSTDPFLAHFSFENILRQLTRIRRKAADRRHSDYFFWSISTLPEKRPEDHRPCAAAELLPPRRQWARPSKQMRKEDFKKRHDVRETAIIGKVLACRREGRLESQLWGRNLLEFVDSLRARIRHPEVMDIHPPMPLLVKKNTTGEVRFRLLCSYPDLSDRLLLGLTASYLQRLFDPMLQDCCHAFRSNRTFTHSTAVQKLLKYRNQHGQKTLYVAECDIQKFFDVIHHDVVLAAFDDFSIRSGRPIAPAARRVFETYLQSYNREAMLSATKDPLILSNLNAIDKLPEEALHAFYGEEDIKQLPIGIPQGNPLSTLVANLVLDAADRAILAGAPSDLLYLRFCDDMIIVHPDREICAAAMERYLATLQALRLPVHPPVALEKLVYGRDYFEAKTKGPFAWGAKTEDGRTMPWVSFLGTKIRYDGQTQARNESIERHMEKLRAEEKLLRRCIGKDGRYLREKDPERCAAILRNFGGRLVAKGVGRIGADGKVDRQKCWFGAFPNLNPNSDSIAQMHLLDHCRSLSVHRIQSLLESASRKSGRSMGSVPYWGFPFSYCAALMDEERFHAFPRGKRKESILHLEFPADDLWAYLNM